MAFPILAAGIGGLILGSFLNVVVHRMPLHQSLASPSSRCPGCGTPVRPYDNVPVVSWLLLRGRCRDCAEPISRRYPVVEAGTALLFALVLAVHADDTARLVLGLVLVAVLVPAALIDLDHRIIPNRLTVPAMIAAVVLGTVLDPGGQPERLAAGAGAGGFLLAAALVNPRGMGMGDVKLAAVMGLFLGAPVAVAMLVGLVAGVVGGIVIVARLGVAAGRKTAVPFGPFLALGGIVAVVAGDPLVDRYLNLF